MADAKSTQGQDKKSASPAGEPIVKPKDSTSSGGGKVSPQGEPIVKP
jgi:hypothetical protein